MTTGFRKIFSKQQAFSALWLALIFPIGGIISLLISPFAVFIIQVVLCLGVAVMGFFTMTQKSSKADHLSERESDTEKEPATYFSTLMFGLQSVIFSIPLFGALIAGTLMSNLSTVSWELFTQPLYEILGANYAFLGIIASVSLLFSSCFLWFAGKLLGSLLDTSVTLGLWVILLLIRLFLLIFVIIFEIINPDGIFVFVFLLMAIFLSITGSVSHNLSLVNWWQVFNRLTPDNSRSAVHSLASTIGALTTIPIMIIGGILLEGLGLRGPIALIVVLTAFSILIFGVMTPTRFLKIRSKDSPPTGSLG